MFVIRKLLCFIFILFFSFFFINEKVVADGIFSVDVETSSDAISLIDLNTNMPIYQKNNKKRMFPASVTKIMTYIIVAENDKDFDGTKITVPKNLLARLEEGSTVSDIKPDEIFTTKKLLELMMIPSGNDAALVLAHHFGGGNLDVFIEKMNEKARDLGCEETHFMNPHGLHDDNHYTTADDLIKITKFALNLPFFQEIVAKTSVFVRDGDKVPLTTTNKLISGKDKSLSYEHATGIKTGTTDKAGGCLVSSAKKKDQTYLCVVLGDFSKDEEKRFTDSKNLYIWAFNNITKRQIVDKKKLIGEVKINYAWKKDTVALAPSEDFACILPKNIDISSVNINLNAPKFVDAPVKAGEKICTATVSYANQELGKFDVVAMTTVERSNFAFFCAKIKEILSSIWFVIGSILFLFSVGSYIALTIVHNKNKEKKEIIAENIKNIKAMKKNIDKSKIMGNLFRFTF